MKKHTMSSLILVNSDVKMEGKNETNKKPINKPKNKEKDEERPGSKNEEFVLL